MKQHHLRLVSGITIEHKCIFTDTAPILGLRSQECLQVASSVSFGHQARADSMQAAHSLNEAVGRLLIRAVVSGGTRHSTTLTRPERRLRRLICQTGHFRGESVRVGGP